MPAITAYGLTGNAYIDGLLGSTGWATNSLTYSFPASGSYYGSGYGSGENTSNFGAFSSPQQASTRAALTELASAANLSFTEIAETSTQHADLRFALSDKPSTAWAYFPSTAAAGGDAWFNKSSGYYSDPLKGSFAFASILHETGHALGLEHAHEANVMPEDRDSVEFTVMSYRSYVGASVTGNYSNDMGGYPQSLMMYDIAALQHMYGANFGTNSGNTTYTWSPTTGETFINGVGQGAPVANRVFETIWDGGGIDTYDFSNYVTGLTIDLRPGSWSVLSQVQLANLGSGHYARANVFNALQYQGDARSLIENVSGGLAADQITGNAAANTLNGLGGADTLMGSAGNDMLNGGEGADTASYAGLSSAYSWSHNSDGTWTLTGAEGTDLLIGIEALRFADSTIALSTTTTQSAPAATDPVISSLTRTGTSAGETLTGSVGADELLGLAGNDTLHGLSGEDILIGGRGRDKFYGGDGADRFDFNSVKDTLTGSKQDVIADFHRDVDRIDLRDIDANRGATGDQRFAWVDTSDLDAAFTGRTGQLRFDNGILMGDTNGDGKADFQIKVAGELLTADILL